MRLATPTHRLVLAVTLTAWVVPGMASQAKAQAKSVQTATPAAQAPAPREREALAPSGRRDPFAPLVQKGRAGAMDIPQNLPPGKAGLVVGTVRLDGIVRTQNGMIAVVANPQNRVYFLREGDRLYNGLVERITMESVSFRERGRDAFGNALDRVVVKRLYPSAGE